MKCMDPNRAIVVIATADQCGVWTALPNGLLQDKIKTRRNYGYSRNAPVQCAVPSFAFLMCPTLIQFDKSLSYLRDLMIPILHF